MNNFFKPSKNPILKKKHCGKCRVEKDDIKEDLRQRLEDGY